MNDSPWRPPNHAGEVTVAPHPGTTEAVAFVTGGSQSDTAALCASLPTALPATLPAGTFGKVRWGTVPALCADGGPQRCGWMDGWVSGWVDGWLHDGCMVAGWQCRWLRYWYSAVP